MDKSSQNPSTSAFSLVFAHMNLNGRLSAAVESDIVGYTTMTLPKGYTLCCAPFKPTTGESYDFPIQEIKGDFTYAGTLPGRTDQLLVWNGRAYETYTYNPDGWIKEGESEPTSDVIPSGHGFFVSRKGSKNIFTTLAGGVIPETSRTVVLNRGYNLIASPYPVDVKIRDIQGNLSSGPTPESPFCDTLMVWQGTQYITYSYDREGWKKAGTTQVTDDIIPAGAAFFIKTRKSDASLTFSRP